MMNDSEPNQCPEIKKYNWIQKLWFKFTLRGDWSARCYHYEGHAKLAYNNPNQLTHKNHLGDEWL